MSGLFGGYLELVNLTGKGVLFLLIGGKAFVPKARTARLVFGSLIMGIVLGVLVAIPIKSDPALFFALPFTGVVFIGILTAILEGIRYYLDEE